MTGRILGAVLAGGESRRFGSDKAAAVFRGRTLLEHAIATLAPHVAEIVVAGRGVADRPMPELGPLGGIAGALHHGRTHGFDRVLTLPCDTPILPDGLIERLLATAPPAIVGSLPVLGLWPTTLADPLADYLAGGNRRAVRAWTDRCGAAVLELDDPIPNVNRPEDLNALRP